jgi:hypothetical protein
LGHKGVKTYKVTLETQTVEVTGTIPYNDLLEEIKKTGKEVHRVHMTDFDLVNSANCARFVPARS